MPVARYFFYVGGVLLALLFISDAVLPKLPVEVRADAGPDRSVIRISSDRKWPERVVFDTSLPTITPVQTAKTESVAPAPATVADMSAKARVRESFAQLVPPDLKKPDPKPQPKRKIAKRRVAPPMMMQVAQQRHFGFFDTGAWNSTW